MKILVITPKYFPDNFAIIPIVEGFIKEGNEVTVLTSMPFDKNGKYLKEYRSKKIERNGNLTIHRLTVMTRKKSGLTIAFNYLSFCFLSSLWARSTKEKFDVIYTFEVSPVTVLRAGNIYKKKHNVKHIVHVLDIWPESLIASSYFKKDSYCYQKMYSWSKKLYSGADELLIGSPSFKSYLEEYLDIKNIPIKYVPQPGLIYQKENSNNPYIEGTFNILYCGNISSIQLVDYIVPAFSKIDNPSIHFYIIGEGRYSSKLKEEINNSPSKDRIHYLGGMNYIDAYDYLYHADALFIGLDDSTLVGHTIPNKLITSLYYAHPIIAMINGDGKKVLENSGGALLIDRGIEALSHAINDLYNMDNRKRMVLGKNNKLYYEQEFSEEEIVRKILLSLSSK